MAATKGQAVTIKIEDTPRSPTEAEARGILDQMVFCALPAQLFKQLSEAAADRQMTLAQLLSTSVADYLKKTEPTSAGKR